MLLSRKAESVSDDYPIIMQPWYAQFEPAVPVAAARKVDPAARPVRIRKTEDDVADAYQTSLAKLRNDLIARILANSPAFFEQLIVDLIVAMGYGGRRRDVAEHLGQSGDGGVDGVVRQDELGLDSIYLQAKRYRASMPVQAAEVRDFVGALEAHHARKGVMVTTSHFSRAARDVASRVPHRISLIDQQELAQLMIRHNLGVRVSRSYQFKTLDSAYFVNGKMAVKTGDAPAFRLLRPGSG